MSSRSSLSLTGLGYTAPRIRARWLPDTLLVTGLIAALAAIIYVPVAGIPGGLPWLVSATVMVAAAALVRRRLPDHPLSGWFAIGAGVSVFAQILGEATGTPGSIGAGTLALLNFFAQVLGVASTICFVYVIGLFPDGQIHRRFERRILRATWWLLLIPPLLLVTTPVVPLLDYVVTDPIDNPFHFLNVGLDLGLAQSLNNLLNSVILVAVVMLVLRYRRFGSTQRKQIRWLLLPSLITVFAVLTYLLFDWPNWFVSVLFIGTTLSLAVSLALAFLRPERVDIDRVLRRSLVYGGLWLAIAAVYVGASAALGVAVGRRLSVGWAITLTVVATLALQPLRGRLERLADRMGIWDQDRPDQGDRTAGRHP